MGEAEHCMEADETDDDDASGVIRNAFTGVDDRSLFG
jgi:hypothetical protein